MSGRLADPNEIKAGDHIYSWRTLKLYAHHGIYVGENMVVHFTNPADGSGLSSSSSPCQLHSCGTKQAGNGVVMSCLKCFLKSGKLYLYQYGMEKWKFIIFGPCRGTCTTAQSDPPQEVIHRAMYLLRNNVFGDYNLLSRNCEDFAMYCKTGLLTYNGSSNQSTFIGRAQDLGLRHDATKVNVENLPISHWRVVRGWRSRPSNVFQFLFTPFFYHDPSYKNNDP